MTSHNNTKPLISQGWLRALLFCAVYFIVLFIAGFLLMNVIKPAGDTKINPLSLYIVFIVNAAVSVLLVWLFRKVIDRQSLLSLGFEWKNNATHAGTGFFLAILLLCIGTLILFFTKYLEWTGIVFDGTNLFIGLVLMLIIAMYEELVFRGYVLNNLMQSLDKRIALLISALMFTYAHSNNPSFTWIAAINIFAAGLLLGINYIYTQNLWFSILFHFSWNFFQGSILGYDVSGMNSHSLFQQEINGDAWITGGKFGFEGSVIATIVLAITIMVFYFIYNRKFRNNV